MLKILLLVLLVIPLPGIGQNIQLQGSYYEQAGIITKSFFFTKSDNRFSFTRYRSAPDNSDASLNGTGKYYFKADTLFLLFDNDNVSDKENIVPQKKPAVISQAWPVHKNNLHVEVVDAASEQPINDCTVTVEDRIKNKVASITDSLAHRAVL